MSDPSDRYRIALEAVEAYVEKYPKAAGTKELLECLIELLQAMLSAVEELDR